MLSYLRKNIFQRDSDKTGRDIPIYLFCYHKVGTVLLAKVFRNLCAENGWTFERIFGKCEQIPRNSDVVLFTHSLIDLDLLDKPYVGVHLIRDPRDVIVSGYLYHKRCKEEWCFNSNFDLSVPILYPRVPYSQEHRPEAWKTEYLKSLRGKSYQQTLNDLTESEGLLFEMNHYGAWTIESMLDWNYENQNVEEIRFEELMNDFDQTFRRMFEYCGFSAVQVEQGLQIAAREDLNRLNDDELERNTHISSRQTTKWHKYFTAVHQEAFKERFGDALVRLGYKTEQDWISGDLAT